MQTPNLIELQVKDYVRILTRHKLLFFGVVAATIAASILFTSRQTPLYTASVDVMIELESPTDAINGTSGPRLDSNRLLENEVGFLESRTVLDSVTDRLGEEHVAKVTAATTRDFITISVVADDAEAARLAANTYASTYLDLRRRAAINDLFETSTVVQGQVDDLDSQMREIDVLMDAELAELQTRIDADLVAQLEAVAEAGDDAPQLGPAAVSDVLLAERSEIERRYEELRQPLATQRLVYAQYLTTVQLNADLTSGAVGRVVSPADLPTSPSSPQPKRNIALGLVVGLFLATAAAMTRHGMRDAVSEEDLAAGLLDIPLLASIPAFSKRHRDEVISLQEPSSLSAEAFRSLRTSIVFSALTDDCRVVQVTSPSMSEGKSQTAANLAVSLAQAQHKVVIIDADLRRPTLASRFGLDAHGDGLSSVLSNTVKLEDALMHVDDLPNLSVLSSGPMPTDPAAFVGARSLGTLITVLRKHFDFVIIDSPPVGLVSDPLTLSQHADGVLVVSLNQKTSRSGLTETITRLRHVDAKVMGLVLNGTAARRGYKSGYYADSKREPSTQLLDLEAPQVRRPAMPVTSESPAEITEV